MRIILTYADEPFRARLERFKKVSQRPHRQDRGFSLTDMNSRQDWTKIDFGLYCPSWWSPPAVQ